MMSLDDDTSEAKDSTSADEPLITKFRYGMLHDLESILWIAIWYLFRTVPAKPSQELTQEVLDAIKANALKVFSRQSINSTRALMIIDSALWRRLTSVITKDYQMILKCVNNFRQLYYAVARGTYE